MLDVPVASRLVVGAVLGLAAVGKWSNLRWFANFLVQQKIASVVWSRMLAASVVLSETVLSVLLLVGLWPPVAASAALALVALFTAVVGLQMVRGRAHHGCGCFGPSRRTPAWSTFAQNAGLMGLMTLAGLLDTVGSKSSSQAVIAFCACAVLLSSPLFASRMLARG
jgi:hypothetical protein